MTSKVYIEILKAIILPDLQQGKDFILEEDSNLGYSGEYSAKNNSARL